MKEYDVVIGLEIHAELKTNSKVFCSCENAFGGEPNTHCCPVCIGLPGALPVINRKAVELTIKAGLAMGCEINDIAIFERKNYFYPDLAKAYQISQLVKPICIGGGIKLDSGKFIRLNRIHLEEDAGKLIHEGNTTQIDYNRAGVPLIEMVSEPDISSADEALEYITKLRNNLIYAGVAECKMEQGGMRCDVNLSIKSKGSNELGTRTEMKNLNSFKMIQRAINYEIERQISVLESGGTIKQQTLKWDDARGENYSMRDKENSNDYRYFPDPDILTIDLDRETVSKIKGELPMLPSELFEMYIDKYNLPKYDAEILTKDKATSSFFNECVALYNNPKIVSNWTMTEVLREAKNEENEEIKISPKQLTDLLKMLEKGSVSRQNAKDLFTMLWGTNDDATKVAESKNMISNFSEADLLAIVEEVIKNNSKAVDEYKATKDDKVVNFLIGQIMKQTKGKANAGLCRTKILEKLN